MNDQVRLAAEILRGFYDKGSEPLSMQQLANLSYEMARTVLVAATETPPAKKGKEQCQKSPPRDYEDEQLPL